MFEEWCLLRIQLHAIDEAYYMYKPAVAQVLACLTRDRKVAGSSHAVGEPWAGVILMVRGLMTSSSVQTRVKVAFACWRTLVAHGDGAV